MCTLQLTFGQQKILNGVAVGKYVQGALAGRDAPTRSRRGFAGDVKVMRDPGDGRWAVFSFHGLCHASMQSHAPHVR